MKPSQMYPQLQKNTLYLIRTQIPRTIKQRIDKESADTVLLSGMFVGDEEQPVFKNLINMQKFNPVYRKNSQYDIALAELPLIKKMLDFYYKDISKKPKSEAVEWNIQKNMSVKDYLAIANLDELLQKEPLPETDSFGDKMRINIGDYLIVRSSHKKQVAAGFVTYMDEYTHLSNMPISPGISIAMTDLRLKKDVQLIGKIKKDYRRLNQNWLNLLKKEAFSNDAKQKFFVSEDIYQKQANK